MQSPPMLLMIVEDDPDIRDSMAQVLQDEPNIRVQVAKNGQEAIDMLVAGDILPDGILLDIMMPQVDGYSVLSKMAENPRLRAIPVIAVTAVASVRCRMHAEMADCCLILQKPFDLDALLTAIRKLPPPVPTPPARSP